MQSAVNPHCGVVSHDITNGSCSHDAHWINATFSTVESRGSEANKTMRSERREAVSKEKNWECPIDETLYSNDEITVWDPESDLPECPDHPGTHLIPLD